jgi:tetratricopeptide (TPR) repeat protein
MENLNGKTTEEHGEKDFDGVFPADINELLCRILPSPDDEDSTDEEDDDLFSGFSDIFGCIFGNNGNDNEMDKYFTIAHLNKDSKFSPNNGLSYFHRAMFYKKHAKYSRAIEDLTKALQFSPDSDLILYERAEAYRA